MFGLSFGKVLLLVAVIAIVFYGFRYLAQVEKIRARNAAQRPVDRSPEPPRAEAKTAAQLGTEDLIKCPVCATYVPARASAPCGRPACPY